MRSLWNLSRTDSPSVVAVVRLARGESCFFQFFVFQALSDDFDTSNIPSGASTAFIESRSSWLSVACVNTTSARK